MADAGRQMNGSILNRGSSTTVVVGEGLLSGLPRITGLDEPPFVVADEITGPLFADFIGERCGLLNLPRGEGTKSLDSLSKIYASLATAGIDRSGTIVALGGGVVGDTAGFAASTWMRGVTLIQCPTTLLAQIDSAIGGKTAVNLPEGKNLVGSFHPARWVVSDVECLRSQADDDFRQGLAEAVKYGMGEDWSFFRWLEENARPVLRRALPALKTLVAECSRMKLAVVDEDERETTGVRARLNLGHTVGHALEAASGYRWRHGDAVAAGMMVAARLSIRMGTLREEELSRLDRLLTVFRIPHRPDMEWDELVPFLARDKKFHSGDPRMVLPRSGEQCTLSSVPMDDIREAYGK
ncbi:MAG: 3-dehydroquinate synthase [Aminobacteriaceae bacterium]